MFTRCVLVVLLTVASTAAVAQPVRPAPSTRIYGELLRLRSLTSVLYVAAHPDDENTRLLSWLATGRHIRTGYLSITRGDGGQNIIGSEQGAALGLIRTYELLAARKLDGAEQFFGRAIDFGFSKNPQETFRQWDSIALIADVVRTIRKFRPDVVICRFPKDSMAGHGQHSASAILAERAMQYINGTLDVSAIDAATLERLLAGTVEWKPKRLLFNAFRFGNRSTVREGMFKLDVGQYDPLIGMGYGELAGISRSIHRSQGAGTPSTPGVQPEYFATLWGPEPTTSLFDGIDTTWSRIGKSDIGGALDDVISAFDMLHPERSVEALLRIRRMIGTVSDRSWRTQKLDEVERVIMHCMGLSAEVTTPTALALAGDSVRTTLRVSARAGRTITLKNATWPDGASVSGRPLPHDSLITADVTTRLPVNTSVTQPYWLTRPPNGALFQLVSNDPPPSVLITFEIEGDTLSTRVPISMKKLDPLKGDVIEALRIVPPVSVEAVTPVMMRTPGATARVRIRAYAPIANAELIIGVLPPPDSLAPLISQINAAPVIIKGISLRAMTDTLVAIPLPAFGAKLPITIRIGTSIYDRTVQTITYDHLPTLQYTTPAVVTAVEADVKITAKRIAYIAGAGEVTPDFLRAMGLTVDEIDDAAILRTDDLLTYDAVLVGIRAINVRRSMQYLMPALLAYVERGGTLIMQYNTLQDMSTKQLGPYPLPLTGKRVTEEDAKVTILVPTHPLLTTPNKIDQRDFINWVQERGLYFPDGSDSHYEALLSMHDTNEAPLRDGLLYARYGKGHYVYCSLSLFRQLPAGVPGAVRLLANMLSLK
jgi:LmbE family N-acetylglucosaminyl deacetylase